MRHRMRLGPLQPLAYAGQRPTPAAAQDSHAVQVRPFRHAVLGAQHSPTAVRPMAVAILSIGVPVHGVPALAHAPTPLIVRVSHACVDHVDVHALTRRVVAVGLIQRGAGLVDAVQPP